MAALATERWLAEKNLAKTIVRETPEPEKKLNSSDFNEEEVNEDTFDSNSEWQKGSYALRKLYHESKKPILVIFSSPSCGPCHVLKPQLKRVIKELDGAVLGVEIQHLGRNITARIAKLGHAGDCKSSYLGSNPSPCSKNPIKRQTIGKS